MRGTNIWEIVQHNFSPFTVGAGRKVSGASVIAFLVVPAAIGLALARLAGPVSPSAVGTFVAVFAVVGAVLTALLTVVQAVVGGLNLSRTYDYGAKHAEKRDSIRLEVLRELYANIAYTVLFLVAVSIPCVVLAVQPTSSPPPEPWPIAIKICSGLIYGVSVLVFVTFLHIIAGVYLVLNDQAEDAATKLKDAQEKAERSRTD